MWLSFTVSLHVQRNKWIKILNSIWWTSSCVLASALNIEIMFKEYTIGLFEMLQWLVHFLLLFCSFQNLGYFVASQSNQEDNTSLSEPLIAQKVETTQTQLGRATLLSKLTFSWVNSLLRLGYSKLLALEDIPFLLPEDEANLAYQAFMHAWEPLVRDNSNNNNKNSVLWSVARTFSKENILIAFYALLRSICMIISPLILYAFVNYTNNTEADLIEGFSILGFMVLSKVVESLCQRHYSFGSRRSGMKIRSALMVAVYQKLLKLSSSARTRHSTGEVMNYIAVDAYRLGEFPLWFHITWTSAVQLVLSIIILFSVVGAGALPGLVPLLICGLLNVPFAQIIHNCQSQFMMAQDERLRSTSEILNSMKIIKLQSWEDKFKNIVLSLRAKEFKWLTKVQIIKANGAFLYWMNPTIVPTVVFLGCALFKSAPLNAGTIFTVITTLRIMGEPVRMIPEALSIMIQVKVSFDRLNTFLLDDEIKGDDFGRTSKDSCRKGVEILAGSFSWDQQQSLPLTLREVNIEIKWEQTVAVCGPVGAGKTSLLHAILGEIPKISGTVSFID